MTQDVADMNFEQALRALEDIVHKLESGEAPLDESIALYERGNALRALCQQRLQQHSMPDKHYGCPTIIVTGLTRANCGGH